MAALAQEGRTPCVRRVRTEGSQPGVVDLGNNTHLGDKDRECRVGDASGLHNTPVDQEEGRQVSEGLLDDIVAVGDDLPQREAVDEHAVDSHWGPPEMAHSEGLAHSLALDSQ